MPHLGRGGELSMENKALEARNNQEIVVLTRREASLACCNIEMVLDAKAGIPIVPTSELTCKDDIDLEDRINEESVALHEKLQNAMSESVKGAREHSDEFAEVVELQEEVGRLFDGYSFLAITSVCIGALKMIMDVSEAGAMVEEALERVLAQQKAEKAANPPSLH
jgi:hypothetical protein